jgi:hypothetical protein
MQEKIEKCMEDFVAKEGQIYLMEDLIGLDGRSYYR